jgi:hypothetical protein
VTAAIALWNTLYLDRALNDLRCGGEMIPEAVLAHLAPVGLQHINLTGDYLWDADIGLAPDGFRALRTTATSLRAAVAARPCSRSGPAYRAILPGLWRDPLSMSRPDR